MLVRGRWRFSNSRTCKSYGAHTMLFDARRRNSRARSPVQFCLEHDLEKRATTVHALAAWTFMRSVATLETAGTVGLATRRLSCFLWR